MSRTWIFQGNPDIFDMDSYLQPGQRVSWTLKQHVKDVRPGDTVFFWRAKGSGRDAPGVVASGVVASEPWLGPDHAARELWRDLADAENVHLRVWIDLERVARSKERLTSSALQEDPTCRGMLILRRRMGTNFALTDEEAWRLKRLWAKVGAPWSGEESLAALYAYCLTYGEEISVKADSPVARVALRIDRSVSSTYQKIMNFRSLDPRDAREGREGASNVDAQVWGTFYIPGDGELDFDRLESAFLGAWGPLQHVAHGEPILQQMLPKHDDEPRRKLSEVLVIVRDSKVTKWVKAVHAHSCQVCGTTIRGRGPPYAEGAHIRPLGRPHHGPDEPSNVLCLCPNHHRAFDLGCFVIEDDFSIRDIQSGEITGRLRAVDMHVVGLEHIRYHRRWHLRQM